MKKRIVIFIIMIFILSIITPMVDSSHQISMESKNILNLNIKGDTLYVGGEGPNNYSTIQKAVDAAKSGDKVYVYPNTYKEYIKINKTITLVGEDKDTTIIEGSLTDNCIKITADSVVVSSFTIKKGIIGVYIIQSSGHEIKNNIIRSNWEGIGLYKITDAKISKNSISDNYFEGINPIQSTNNTISTNRINWNLYGILLTESNNNSIYENEIKGNTRGIETIQQSNNNEIYHNNFYVSEEDNAFDDFTNIWDNDYPSGGNYWDDYTGEDNDGDGIGDTPYNIPGDGKNKDRYPLMEPYVPQQPPQTPIITGPTIGLVGEELTFCISSVVDPEGDQIFVFWDWDDGNITGWQGPFPSGTEVCENHTWTENGTYTIKAKLKDEHNAESGWGIHIITIFLQNPPEKPIITGPTKGVPGQEYTYCISPVIDPEGDQIFVLWDWDDGTTTNWQGPYPSGTEVCENHTWTEIGTYTIKAKLKDEQGAESQWGTLEVTIPRNRVIPNIIIIKFLQHFRYHFKMLIQLLQ